MSDLYREGARIDRCEFCGQNMVRVEPAGMLYVTGHFERNVEMGEFYIDQITLPPGKYLIVKADGEVDDE